MFAECEERIDGMDNKRFWSERYNTLPELESGRDREDAWISCKRGDKRCTRRLNYERVIRGSGIRISES
jgi:hypothetical protein